MDFALAMIKLGGFGGESEYWDHNLEAFTLMAGIAAVANTHRKVGVMALMMVIAAETDEAAFARWEHYVQGTDLEALEWQRNQAGADKNAPATSTAASMVANQKADLSCGRYFGLRLVINTGWAAGGSCGCASITFGRRVCRFRRDRWRPHWLDRAGNSAIPRRIGTKGFLIRLGGFLTSVGPLDVDSS